MEKLNTSVILTRGAYFEGHLGFEGMARLCGRFKGEIVSQGTLIIDSGARVEARISVGELILKGWMKGEVTASQKINLISGSEFYGALSSPQLHIEEGALFEGASVKTSVLKAPSSI